MQKVLHWVWQGFFILLYPFLSLFSLVFTGLVWVLSVISAKITAIGYKPNAAVITEKKHINWNIHEGYTLQLSYLKSIHFGPELYRIVKSPEALNLLNKKVISLWHYSGKNAFYFQVWPNQQEHQLENYELWRISLVDQMAEHCRTFRDFEWQVSEIEGKVTITCPSTEEQFVALGSA